MRFSVRLVRFRALYYKNLATCLQTIVELPFGFTFEKF